MFEDVKLKPNLRLLKDDVIGDVGSVLWVLMGTIGMVLLIACANVANLLLVRAEGRQQELAVRAALGASRGRIAYELLAESIVLGLVGGVAGLGLAYAAVRALLALAPGNLPRLDNIAIDPLVLLFTLVVSIVAGLLFGAIPVFKYAGPNVAPALRGGGRNASASRERHRARSTLVVVQVALALVLLVGSGLMIRTFQALRQVNPGFTNPQDVLTLSLSIPEAQVKEPEAVVRMHQAIMDRIAAIPGVTAVGLTSVVPITGRGRHDPIFAADRNYQQGELPPIRTFKFISPGLLKTMGNTIVAGRDFTWADLYDMRPVAMVSENLARELWKEPSAALGKQIRDNPGAPWREVIAVIGDERDDGIDKKAPAIAFWPMMMAKFSGNEVMVRRTQVYTIRSTRAGSTGFVNEVSRAVWAVNPESAARRRAYPAGSGRRFDGAHVVHPGDAGDRRRDGAAARRRRDLRRDFVLGLAAHPRDRDPDGAWRAARRGDADVRPIWPRPRGGRHSLRPGGRGGAGAGDGVAAVRGQPDGSADLRRGLRQPGRRRDARQLLARAARDRRQPGHRAAGGVMKRT